jgi:hypothetical protein
VALVRTVVVCAPKIFSVIPEPKAAPNPSLRGRCMRTTKVSRTQTITRMVSKIGIKIDSHIRAGNMGRPEGVVKDEVWEWRKGEWASVGGQRQTRLMALLSHKSRRSHKFPSALRLARAFLAVRPFAVSPRRFPPLTSH